MNDNKKGFFPIFLDIRKRKMIFIGGGKIALRRIKTLLEFDTSIEVISPKLEDELLNLSDKGRICAVNETWQAFDKSGISKDSIVFACTDDEAVNHDIFLYAKANEIPVNNCSNHDECDFYFPGIVNKDNVTIAVNAGGSAHKRARGIREKIEKLLESENG